MKSKSGQISSHAFIIALSKAETARTFLIANGNWFQKRIPLTNTEAPGLTDGQIKLEVLTERAPIRSAKR
jgi:hypothetical protein